jgi:hypothetical protein
MYKVHVYKNIYNMHNNTCNTMIKLYCYVLKILPQNTIKEIISQC